jgi:hypothetical protein
MRERTKSLLDWASRNRAVVWGSLAVPPFYFAFSWMVNDYRGWRNLGPGGLPYNICGWLLQWMIRLIFAKNDTKGLSCYDQPNKTPLPEDEEAKNQRNYVGTLPHRSGPNARAAPWVIPQRQLNFQPDLAVVEVRPCSNPAFPYKSLRWILNRTPATSPQFQHPGKQQYPPCYRQELSAGGTRQSYLPPAFDFTSSDCEEE